MLRFAKCLVQGLVTYFTQVQRVRVIINPELSLSSPPSPLFWFIFVFVNHMPCALFCKLKYLSPGKCILKIWGDDALRQHFTMEKADTHGHTPVSELDCVFSTDVKNRHLEYVGEGKSGTI